MSVTDAHRLFLQVLMAQSALKEEEAITIAQECCTVAAGTLRLRLTLYIDGTQMRCFVYKNRPGFDRVRIPSIYTSNQ